MVVVSPVRDVLEKFYREVIFPFIISYFLYLPNPNLSKPNFRNESKTEVLREWRVVLFRKREDLRNLVITEGITNL